MRILFSADWHLGFALQGTYQQGRLPDQLRQLRRLVEYIEEHDVDVLAVAGDVFEAQERGPALAAVHGMAEALARPLSRGLKVVMIAGNHDRDYFMETAAVWLGVEAGEGGGHFALHTRPCLLPVSARGETVSFVLLPYPNGTRYPVRQEDAGGTVQRNQRIAAAFIDEMGRLQAQAAALALPAVLMTHVTIEGHTVNAHRLSAREDVAIPRGAFPQFEMTVIGHIHKAERFGRDHFYYVGALDRMDAGERDYEPRVLLADIGPRGVREVTSLPLDPTPIAEVVAASEAEIESAAAHMRRREETLVKLRLRVPYGTYTQPLADRARALFPRLYGNVEHIWEGRPVPTEELAGLNPADVPGTLRWYLGQQDLPEDELTALMELVEELRREGGEG